MKNSLLITAAIVLGSVGVSFARDRHHHHSSRSHHSSHRSHYRGHSLGHSIFSFGLSFGRSHHNYGGYGYSPSYYSGYGYSPSYYSGYSYSPSYYGYSSPACVIQSAPVIEVEIPPTPRRKVYPVPPRVEPLESNPNIGPASQRSNYGQPAVARQSQFQQPRGTSEIPVFDLQNFGPESRSLTSNDGIPFVVSSPASQSIANNKTQTQLPLLPPLPVKEKTVAQPAPVIPKEMRGIALLSLGDQRAAISQRTCPVTGDLLGADGKPIKVEYRGKTVFVCCQGCVTDLRENPERYLARQP